MNLTLLTFWFLSAAYSLWHSSYWAYRVWNITPFNPPPWPAVDQIPDSWPPSRVVYTTDDDRIPF